MLVILGITSDTPLYLLAFKVKIKVHTARIGGEFIWQTE